MHVWEACTKNPGHQKFISVNEFFKNHLPKNHLPNDLVHDFDKSGIDLADTVRHLADVTVRLRVSYVSPERPSGDPFDSYRGTTIQRFGSGWITDIREDRTGNTCPCAGCSSTSERRERYCFHVRTACHVVYNTEEAKSTMVDLFYDDETNPFSESEKEALRNRRCRKQLQCIDLVSSNSYLDVTTLVCATHDSEIYHRLKSALCLLERQQSKLEENFECLSFKEKFDVCEPSKPKSRRLSLRHLPLQSYVLIISHPHGMPKKVTVGVLQSLEKSSDEALYRPVYDATTCPGSSGAPVFILPREASVTRGGMIKFKDILKHRSVNLTEIFYTHCTWKESTLLLEKVTGNCMMSAKRPRNAVFHYTQCPGPGLPLRKTQGKKKTSEILCFRNTTNKSSPGQSDTEADMDNILVAVIFPKGEIKYCEVYFHQRTVKEEKTRLLCLGYEDYGSPDNFSLQLISSSGAESPITMDDDVEILHYWDCIADDTRLKFIADQPEAPEIGPALGVSLKQ